MEGGEGEEKGRGKKKRKKGTGKRKHTVLHSAPHIKFMGKVLFDRHRYRILRPQ